MVDDDPTPPPELAQLLTGGAGPRLPVALPHRVRCKAPVRERARRDREERGAAMQYLLLGYDGKDDQALERRLAVRDQHLAHVEESKASGNVLYGAAVLDDADRMIGSMMVLEFDDRAALDAWLAREPYVAGNVWQDLTIQPCQVGPAFAAPSG